VLDSLAYCRSAKGMKLYAYVLMDNHLHLVAESPRLGEIIRDFKRHTASRILEAAESSGRDWLLNQFAYYRKKHKQESSHQIWQEGFHPQLIQGAAMLRQKITYIHENPVRKGWGAAPEHWRYSSASHYLEPGSGPFQIDELPEG
ncbi:MAG: hypothetical protein RLZZ303_737, partial [Candidatus Hydrogenedentota bacterium]